MPDTTTLICLFHHEDIAQAALKDLMDAGIPASSVSMIDSDGPREENSGNSLDSLGVPARDQQHLLAGVNDGGVIVAVSAMNAHEEIVEGIFKKHSADKIDEMERENNSILDYSASETAAAAYAEPDSTKTATLVAEPSDFEDDAELGDVRTLRMYRTTAVPSEAALEADDLDNETRRDV